MLKVIKLGNVPQYLERIKPSKKYYGTLKKEGKNWIIKAEPQAMNLFRRLFDATRDDEKGITSVGYPPYDFIKLWYVSLPTRL